MWDRVVLDKDFGRAFIKLAVREGYLKIITPETADERSQVRRYLSEFNRSRSDTAALSYGLLAQSLAIPNIGNAQVVNEPVETDGLEGDELDAAVAQLSMRPLFEDIATELHFVQPPDFDLMVHNANDWVALGADKQAAETAKLEPLLYQTIRSKQRRAKGPPIDRALIRSALDLIALNPQMISEGQIQDLDDTNANTFQRVRSIVDHSYTGSRSDHNLDTMTRLCKLVMLESPHVWARVHTAEALNAVLPVGDLTFGKDRYGQADTVLGVRPHETAIAATRLFLREIEHWPAIESVADLIRVRSHPQFEEFRSMLQRWVIAVSDPRLYFEEQKIRAEIAKANQSLSRTIACGKVAGWFAYLGIPLAIVDYLYAGGVLGAAMSVAGFGVQAAADAGAKKSSWLLVGRN